MLPLEEDILNDLLTALLSEISSHDLGIHKRHRIARINAVVEVQKLTPKPTCVNTCKDLAKYFISRIVKLTNKYDEVKVVFDKYEEDFLKQATRISRSAVISPVPCIVDDQTNITNISMSEFLSHRDTKDRLTRFLEGNYVNIFQINVFHML